jgi:hypothetical protein
MVPNIYFKHLTKDHFDLSIRTDEQEAELERKIPDFVGEMVLKSQNIARYKGVGPDGINHALYDDMSDYFREALGLDRIGPQAKMPLPTGTVRYGGKNLTPLQYMAFLGFNPDDYVAITTSDSNQELALQAVKAALDQDFVVPIGIVIFGDQVSVKGSTQGATDLQSEAEKTGLFWVDGCSQQKCTNDGGGHEVSTVNYLSNDGHVTALIVKNSWGAMGGRDANGVPVRPNAQMDTGYFIVTAKYLAQNASSVNDPWDFIIPKTIAGQKRFRSLE